MANTYSADFGSSNTDKYFSRSSSFGIGHQNVTFSFWIKVSTEITSGIWTIMKLRTSDSSNYIDWIIQYDYNGGTRRLIFNRSKPGVVDVQMFSNQTLGTSNWHHIYFKYDTATMRGGMDGAELVNQATSGIGIGGGAVLNLGGDGSTFLSGKIDDVRFFDTNLSDATVWGFYTSPTEYVGNEANLRAYYTFNSSLTTDLTSNAYTLTNNNTVTQSTDIPFPNGDTTPRYWVGGTGTWDSSTATHWSLTSGGSGGASSPVFGTTAIYFDSNSGGGTVTTSGALMFIGGSLTMTGFTGTLTIASSLTVGNCTLGTGMTLNGTSSLTCNDFISGTATTIAGTFTLACLGNFTLTSGSTYTYTGVITLAATTSVTITTAGKTIGSVVVFNGTGGIWTLQDNFLCTGASITLTNGSLLLNNFNLTVPTFASANTNTRALTLSTGLITLTGSGTVWDTSTTTNLTLTSTGSTIKLTDATSTGKTFSGGGLTFNNLWLTGAGTGAYTIVGDNTFNDFKCDTPPHTINFTASSTTKVLTFTVNGTTGNLMTLQSTSSGSAWNIVRNTGGGVISCDYLSLQDSHATAL